jgi:Fe-Mn family superoxide dismutase
MMNADVKRVGLEPGRREMMLAGAAGLALAAAGAMPRVAFGQAAGGPVSLPPLPYAPEALEPHIDAQTMSLHHDKHHQAYVTNLNKALSEHSQLASLALPELLRRLPEVPEGVRNTIRNNGGGHANHAMFWSIMGPKAGGAPTGAVADAITRDLGGFEDFKKTFNTAGTKQFGSGWVFVTATMEGKLEIVARPNQDTPLMEGKAVLMGNDVWEHAYYLKYQNRRADYLAAWWNVVNWKAVNDRYAAIRRGELI